MKSFQNNTTALIISNTSIFLTTFIVGIILARFLSIDLLGQYRIVTTYSALTSAIATIQIQTAILYFVVHYEKKMEAFLEASNQLALFLALCGGLIFGIAYFLLSILKGMMEYRIFTIIVYSGITSIKILMLIYPAVFVAKGNTKNIVQTSLIYSISQIIMIPTVVILYGSYKLLLLADLGSTLLAIIGGGYLKQLIVAQLHPQRIKNNFLYIQIILRYSKYLAFSNAIRSVAYQIDRIILSILATPASYGIYSVVAIENPLNKILLNSFNTSLVPEMKEKQKTANLDGMWRSWHKSISYSCIHLFPIMWFTLIFSESILKFLFGESFAVYSSVLAVVSLIVLVRVASYQTLLRIYGHTEYNLRSTIIAFVVSLPIMVYVVTSQGLLGLALSYALNWIVYNAIVIFYVRKVSNEKIIRIIGLAVILKQLIVSGLLFVVSYVSVTLLPIANPLIVMIITGIFFIFIYFPYYYYQRREF